MPILTKALQEMEAKGILPSVFYKASIILITKPDRNITRKL